MQDPTSLDSFMRILLIGMGVLRQIRKFGPLREACLQHPHLEEFVNCDLCLGSWLMMVLCALFGVELSPLKGRSRVINIFISGIFGAFAIHVVKLGLREFWWSEMFTSDAEPGEE